MHEAVLKGAFENISIGEFDLAVAVETLEISVGSRLDLNLTVPAGVVFGGQFEGQEGGWRLMGEELCHCLKNRIEYNLEYVKQPFVYYRIFY